MAQVQLPLPTSAAERYTVTLDGIDWEFIWRWNVREEVWLLSLTGPLGPVFRGKPLLPKRQLLRPTSQIGRAPQGYLYLLEDESPGLENTDEFTLIYSPQSYFIDGEITEPV
jgi:hypothetical protein